MKRRAQAILPFFGLQLVCIIIFFIVLITILKMSANVKMVTNEFDEKTQETTAIKRLLTNTDCFAAEEVSVQYFGGSPNENPKVLYGSRPLPGLIDFYKLNDFEFFNCMRKDRYEVDHETMLEGQWDAYLGSGGAFKYDVAVYDFDMVYENPPGTGVIGGFVYNTFEASDDLNKHYMNSVIARLNKNEKECNEAIGTKDSCGSRYGSGWDCITNGAVEEGLVSVTSTIAGAYAAVTCGILTPDMISLCNTKKIWSEDIDDITDKPLECITDTPGNIASCYSGAKSGFNGLSEGVGFIATDAEYKIGSKVGRCQKEGDFGLTTSWFPVLDIRPLWSIDSNNRWTFAPVDALIPNKEYSAENIGQESYLCNNTVPTVLPVLIKKGEEIHNGIFFLRTCVIKGLSYTYDTGFEAEIKPLTESGCIGK